MKAHTLVGKSFQMLTNPKANHTECLVLSDCAKEVCYTGRTWCVNVPHGFIVTKRFDSVPVIMGNCIVAHGASEFLKEIMMEKSDNFQCFVCKSCGLLGQVNPVLGIYQCKTCEGTTEFAQVRVPYAYKLFAQELESMNISSRILPESKLRLLADEASLTGTASKLP